MAWTAPRTAVAGATFSAAQFNANVRDNLNETAPAKATAASQLFVSTGPNAIAARVPSTARVDTAESTSSTSYVDLATPGPLLASDAWALSMDGNAANNFSRASMAHVFTGLTAGNNTFRMQYAVGSNTGTFKNREINVIPL